MSNNLMVGDVVYMNYCFEADCEENQHGWKVKAVNGNWVFLEGYGGSFRANCLFREKPAFFTPFLPYNLSYMKDDRWLGWTKQQVTGWTIEETIEELNTETYDLKRSEKKAIYEKEIIIQKNIGPHEWEIVASVKLDWRHNKFVISHEFKGGK